MKYAVAGLSLLVMVSSTLVANSGKNAPAPYQKPLVQGKSVMEMAEVQSQPSSQAGSHPETGKAGDKSVTKGVDTDGARDTASAKARMLKIGITAITSSTDQSLSVDGLQQELANDINFLGGKAVILAADPNDRDAANEQAKQQGCDYLVFTEITNFKTVSVGQKLGSVLNSKGGLGGVGGNAHGRVEISANVRIFQPDVFTPALDGSSDFRGNDVDNTAKGLMRTEARTIMLELKKLESKAEK